MDLNALLQGAMQDPQAAAFIQKLLSGGSSPMERLPKINPVEVKAHRWLKPGGAPLDVFDSTKGLMDEMLGGWKPPGPVAAPMDPNAAPMDPNAAPMDPNAAPPQGPVPPLPPGGEVPMHPQKDADLGPAPDLWSMLAGGSGHEVL